MSTLDALKELKELNQIELSAREKKGRNTNTMWERLAFSFSGVAQFAFTEFSLNGCCVFAFHFIWREHQFELCVRPHQTAYGPECAIGTFVRARIRAHTDHTKRKLWLIKTTNR